MGTYERRWLILKMLCRKRHMTIADLSETFFVSERTIRRDIEVLSLDEPVYTSPGRYNGGVYVVDGYSVEKNYFNNPQKSLIQKMIQSAENGDAYLLEKWEVLILKEMIALYSKPSLNT